MPSKRKKSKRRTRRVHAERRIREEQHAAGIGTVKGTPGVAAVAAPPQISKCPPLVRLPQISKCSPIVCPPEISNCTPHISPPQISKCPPIAPPPEISNCPPIALPTPEVKVPVVESSYPLKKPEPEVVVTAEEAEVGAAEVTFEAPDKAPVKVEDASVKFEEAPVQVEEAPVQVEEAPVKVAAPNETPDVVDSPVKAPGEVEVKASGEAPVKSPDVDILVETSVEPPTEQIAAVQEVENPLIPNTNPLTEAAPIPEAPVLAPAKSEVQDSVVITTEISQTHDKRKDEMEAEIVSEVQAAVEGVVKAEPEPTIEDKAPVLRAEVQAEEVVIKAEDSPLVEAEPNPVKPGPELVLETNAKLVVEAEVQSEEVVIKTKDHPDVKVEDHSVIKAEALARKPESELVVKVDTSPVVEAEVEATMIEAEDHPVVKADLILLKSEPEFVVEAKANLVVETEVQPEDKTKDRPIVEVEASPKDVEAKESLVVKEDGPVKTEAPEEVRVAVVDPIINTLADDFVMTESVPAVMAAMAEPKTEEQVFAIPTDEMNALSESLNNFPPVSEPASVTADEILNTKEEINVEDSTDKKLALDVLSGDFSVPQPIISDLQCPAHFAAAPAPMDIPAEAGLNGHTAAEAAVEGLSSTDFISMKD